jgi:hypothetical protein
MCRYRRPRSEQDELGTAGIAILRRGGRKRAASTRRKARSVKAGKGSGKAIIATARKLLCVIYDTLKHDWVFKDFSHFEIEPEVA